MAQQVQELIDKIKAEGIEKAKEQAKVIEAEAKTKAKEILTKADEQARQVIANAHKEQEVIQQKTRNTLEQAARDMVLNLKKEIQNILRNIITQKIQAALTPEQLAGIINAAIKNCLNKKTPEGSIVISISPKDLEKLQKGLMAKLQQDVKKGVTFQSTEIAKGFTISFDGGKSYFDFSDASLAEYLSAALNPEVSNLLKEATSKKHGK